MVFKSHTDLTDLTDLLRCKQRGFSFGLYGKTPKESKIREIRVIRVGKFKARAHLMRWIVRCTQLYEQLLKSGYNKSCKEFNPLQVSYIFFHLGEP